MGNIDTLVKELRKTEEPPAISPYDEHTMCSVKDIAKRLSRHPNYIYLMRKAGFPMPGGRTTMRQTLDWLQENPNWRRKL